MFFSRFYALMKRKNGQLMLDTRDCPSKLLRLTKEAVGTEPSEKCDDLVIVEYVDPTVRKGKCPRCGEVTEEDIKKTFGVTNPFSNTTLKPAEGKTMMQEFVEELNKQFKQFNINNCNRKLMFLTFCFSETGFNTVTEDLNYTSEKQLIRMFGGRPKIRTNPEKFLNNPVDLGNYVYGMSMDKPCRLGFGNLDDDKEGYLFRGRGMIQVTGRHAYQSFNDWLKQQGESANIMANPDLISTNLAYVVKSALWFLFVYKVPEFNIYADRGNILSVHFNVAGVVMANLNGRLKKYRDAIKNYGLSECAFNSNPANIIDIHVYHDGKIERHVPKGFLEKEKKSILIKMARLFPKVFLKRKKKQQNTTKY